MGVIQVSVGRLIEAPAETVYGYIADMREHHPRFLPPAFSDFKVESGGIGAGTVNSFTLALGGMTRQYRMTVAEPDPGRVLTESDANSSAVTTFTVTPEDADSCRVQIGTQWNGATGIGGFFERTFAPRVLRRLYTDELSRLNSYARSQSAE